MSTNKKKLKGIKPTVAEYFAGIGLIRMGLESRDWNIQFANDISEKKYEMYKTFFPNDHSHYIVDDIFKVDYSKIPLTTLATCSFPCKDISLAGNLSGINGAHSSAFWGFIKSIKYQGSSSPPLLLVENVPGWISSNDGNDFKVTIHALNNLGYSCDPITLDARRFTPQSRLRVFLICSKHHSQTTNPKHIIDRSDALASDPLKEAVEKFKDLRWFSADIPEPPQLLSDGLAEIIEKLDDDDDRWWPDDEVNRHFEMMDKSHSSRVIKLISEANISYRTFYRRRRNGFQRAEVRPDDIAGCLRTATGGSGKQFLIEAGNGKLKMRTLTEREYARLQGVPDNYPIGVEGVQALTGFGDAVCVPAITWITENILANLIADIP